MCGYLQARFSSLLEVLLYLLISHIDVLSNISELSQQFDLDVNPAWFLPGLAMVGKLLHL